MQEVILVNEQDEPIGVMEKMEAHEKALLHRAFSVFLFSKNGDMLLQQRALSKYHSPGLWTNACCSHPAPGESNEEAALRRLGEELGIITPVKKAFHFTYKAGFDNGLTEHEFDHVFIGVFDDDLHLNPEEVASVSYKSMDVIEQELEQFPEQYTAWFKIAFPLVKHWMHQTNFLHAAS
ncbi:MAG: isopentenyl-diphosphate Delta-isomerase [Chitinophagaceae bacterium]